MNDPSQQHIGTPALIRRFAPYLMRYKRILIFDLFCAALTTLCDIVLPKIMSYLTNAATDPGIVLTVDAVLKLALLYLILRLIDGAAQYFMSGTGHIMGVYIETDMRRDAFAHLQRLSHTYYSNTNQPYPYAGYRIFVAEVASTCNEALLMQYLLKNCTDLSEKKYLMNHYFEQFKGTLFRQTMFAEFEMITHKMAEDGEVLSAQALCDVYRKLNEEYFGEDMVIDDEIALEWSRIPHFYTPFYVYQYATGYSAAIAIASKIFKGDEKTLKGYKQFLSGGCSMHPIDLLKLCGIDMESPQVIQEALDVFGKLLEEWD